MRTLNSNEENIIISIVYEDGKLGIQLIVR